MSKYDWKGRDASGHERDQRGSGPQSKLNVSDLSRHLQEDIGWPDAKVAIGRFRNRNRRSSFGARVWQALKKPFLERAPSLKESEMENPVNLETTAKSITSYWDQLTIANSNGALFKLARGMGSTTWHKHEAEDEAFYVLDGALTIQLRDRDVVLHRGDFFVVPKGVEHCPRVEEEVFLLVVGTSVTSTTEGGKPAWGDGQGGDIT
ncbi:MAG: cupin domain-containing protein [Pseudomonadota bacterium]